MKRRDFIRNAGIGALSPSLINGFPVSPLAASPIWHALTNITADTNHVLVIVQLNGGNDGLNMVLALDQQYDNLKVARTNILMDKSAILKLNGFDATGLHPAMTGMQDMFNNGKLKILQGVSYPQPNFSHFRATDIWLTGADSNQVLTTGWQGRYMQNEYANYPNGYPNSVMPDPIAIQISSTLSTAFQGTAGPMGITISNPTALYNFVNGIQDPAPAGNIGKELTYLRTIQRQSQQYGDVIKNAYNKGANLGTYPNAGTNSLADQLKIVARLIKGGLKTRVYMVNTGGFDNHSNQVNAGDFTKGTHANLLGGLSLAISSFQNDIAKLGVEDRVLGMTFSEFGRRIKSNASLGTDHGAGLPMFVFGSKLHGGVLGTNPIIPANATVNDNVAMQYDFRSVYATLLKDWFCASDTDLQTILLKNYQNLPIVNSQSCISTDVHDVNVAAGKNLISPYPNPFTSGVTIDFETFGGHTSVQVFDTEGRLMATPVDGEYVAGKYKVWYNGGGLPTGVYYARLQNNAVQQVKSMLKVE